VFWWFQRKGEFVRYETRENGRGGYALVVVMPDGTERVEDFPDATSLNERQIILERELTADGWTGPHGWNL